MRKVTLFCAAALFSLLSFAQDNNADIVKVGDSMPAFTLHSTVNGTVNAEDLKGKVVLINIFATWCGPCQSELAEVQKTLWPKYKDNKDFCMLVIGREHTDDQLTEYNKRKGFTFPLYPDPKREVTGKFASQYIPRSYLIDKEGKVIASTVGYKKEEIAMVGDRLATDIAFGLNNDILSVMVLTDEGNRQSIEIILPKNVPHVIHGSFLRKGMIRSNQKKRQLTRYELVAFLVSSNRES